MRSTTDCNPLALCGMHGAAAESRESIAVAVHDIDITGALCNAFFQNTGALVG